MQSYQLATPRLALGTAAVAVAAITLGVLVIIPATMDVDAHAFAAPAFPDGGRDTAALIAQHEMAAAPCVLPAAAEAHRGRSDAAL